MNEGKKVVMLISHCFSSNVLYNHLSETFEIDTVLVEEPLRGMALARRRVKKLGLLKVSGQVLFSAIIVPLLRKMSSARISEIRKQYRMSDRQIPEEKCLYFSTINDPACITKLVELRPDIVIVNGTRIISKKLLSSINAIFINMHAGITPEYRGVHGGYWALYNKDAEHCGVTVHLVDQGIDTGNILYQGIIPVTTSDNFSTYPDLQLGEGLPLFKRAVSDAVSDRITPMQRPSKFSRLWYHPGFWQYCFNRLFRGIK